MAAVQGLLHADGLLTVQGAEIADASITVVPANGSAYALNKGTQKFVLELDLNNTYLVIFEHPRCLTKQLYFDTRVPDDYKMDHYNFPFEVVLEVEVQVETKEYVGPVGYIKYMDLVNDFGYETDYTLKIDEKLKEKMTELRTMDIGSTVSNSGSRAPSVGTPGSTVASSTSATSISPASTSGISSTATRVGPTSSRPQQVQSSTPPEPIVREEGPGAIEPIAVKTDEPENVRPSAPLDVPIEQVPVTMDPVEEQEDPAVAEIPETPAQHPDPIEEVNPVEVPEPITETIAENAAEPIVEEERPASRVGSAEKSSPGPRLPTSRASTVKYDVPDPAQFGRQEELIVEDNKVTTIVRIVNELGYKVEYRRIAHKFGPVFYFKDEQSIPEHMYYDDTGLPMH